MTKLVIIPGIFITAAILLGFRDTALLTIMTLFGAPTAVSSYPTAEALGGNGELAGLMVVVITSYSIHYTKLYDFYVLVFMYWFMYCLYIGSLIIFCILTDCRNNSSETLCWSYDVLLCVRISSYNFV